MNLKGGALTRKGLENLAKAMARVAASGGPDRLGGVSRISRGIRLPSVEAMREALGKKQEEKPPSSSVKHRAHANHKPHGHNQASAAVKGTRHLNPRPTAGASQGFYSTIGIGAPKKNPPEGSPQWIQQQPWFGHELKGGWPGVSGAVYLGMPVVNKHGEQLIIWKKKNGVPRTTLVITRVKE